MNKIFTICYYLDPDSRAVRVTSKLKQKYLETGRKIGYFSHGNLPSKLVI